MSSSKGCLGSPLKSSVIQKRLNVELPLLFIGSSQEGGFGLLTRMPPGHLLGECFKHVQLGGHPRADPGSETPLFPPSKRCGGGGWEEGSLGISA